jgi:3-deoxy-D-manno-octulosonic-acid transferase
MYYFAILIASPFHWKAKKWIKGRRDWQHVLSSNLKNDCPKIWIYSPSIGEFQECKKFVRRITEEKKDHQFIFTFHSPSGFDQARIPCDDAVRMMLPLDTVKNAKKFLDIVAPVEMYVLATGVWPNYVRELTRRNIPHYWISFYGHVGSSFFKPWLKSFYKPLVNSFDTIFGYDQDCKSLLKQHYNYEKVVTIANLRFDSILEMKRNLRQIKGIEKFVGGQFCFVAGSTEKKEDKLLIEAFQKLRQYDIKWIIVPHEKLKRTLKKLQKKFMNDMCFFSENIDYSKKVLVMDITGYLFQLYQYADICLVGRGFSRFEIHNMLEPAVFYKPVLIGPKHKRFSEPRFFIENKLAFEFNDEDELAKLIYGLYTKEITVDANAIKEIFDQNCMWTDIVMENLKNRKLMDNQFAFQH